MKRMRVLAAALTLVAVSAPAFAADMALKAPPPVAPAWSWTGWYAGVNVGGSFGKANDSASFGAPAVPFVPGSTSSNLNGVIGGGQLGYNLQSGSFVYGLEADIQGSGERGTANSTNTVIVPIPGALPVVSTGNLTDNEKLPWFGTLRGRLGLLASPTWLLYVTGGLAYGEIKSNETLTVGALAATSGFNTTRAGWTLGGGVEGVISGNWTAKLEYLYMDFGTINNTFAGVVGSPFTPINLSTHVTDNVVRVGLNYHFH
jgi:outer membrane immunogenic protein